MLCYGVVPTKRGKHSALQFDPVGSIFSSHRRALRTALSQEGEEKQEEEKEEDEEEDPAKLVLLQ